jgi:AcrR family transcriptional regulator
VEKIMAEHRKMNNNDRRVKRTKKALYDALLILLKEKSINEITVTELTNQADVNRATFYFYYTDLLDMLQQIQNETYQAFKEIIDSNPIDVTTIEGFTDYSEKLLTFCKEHETLVRFVINHDTNNQLYKQMRYLMVNNIPNSKITFDDTNPARYSTNFIITAMVGIMEDWMDEGMKIPAREVAEFCANIYIKGLCKTRQLYIDNNIE